MKDNEKKILVLGLGRSGLAMLDYLDKRNVKVLAFDNKKELPIDCSKWNNVEFHIGENPTGEEEVDQLVISPGVPLHLPFIETFRKREVEILGEVEFAYRNARGTFVGVTGTNGKTTTTTLLGEFFKEAHRDTKVVGNIGNPVIRAAENATEDTWYVSELSSFQLETVRDFKCHIAGFLNLTPDHLNRHGSLECYGGMKANIFRNQTKEDFAVLNFEDEYVKKLADKIDSTVLWFSAKRSVPHGLYLEDGAIISNLDGEKRVLFSRSDVALPGNHNMENVLMAMCMAYSAGISFEIMHDVLKKFQGVEHRLEFVREVAGVRYINDSKGTNPDASTKAVEAFDKNLILIAGGMDKKVPFDKFIETFQGKVKKLILLGETKHIIESCAKEHGFDEIVLVKDMEEAVETAYQVSVRGDIVLLSPACASWDMYESYEVRGEDFKTLVGKLEEK